MYHVLEVNLKK